MPSAAPFDLDHSLDLAGDAPDSRRAAVLREAEELFARQGYASTTVREIADAAGVNVATLHLHWKDKATLYEAVCRAQARHLLAFWQGAAAEPAAKSGPSEQLKNWVERGVDLLHERSTLAPIALQAVADTEVSALPSLFSHDVSVFRLFEGTFRDASLPERGADAPLSVLCLFYFLVLAFVDSPLQREMLGGSVYADDAVRRRVKDFASSLSLQLLGVQ